MPGLLAIVSDRVDSAELLERMIGSIKHDQRYRVDRYAGGPFSVARVHLGISNPQPQPVFNEDRTLCLLMEGNIYNGLELKKRLRGSPGLAADSEPALCLRLYQELGPSFVELLNGAFTLLICDLEQRKAIAATDRFRLVQLYYALHNGSLLLAPEAKALLQDNTFKRELDTEALVSSYAFGEFWGERTLFKRVQALPPASILTYSGGDLSVTQYWRFSYRPDYAYGEEEMVEDISQAFRQAVARRMQDPVRYGVSLSGGMDCRTILAAMDPQQRREVTTYNYGPRYCDQAKIAARVAKVSGTKHRFIEIVPEMIVRNAHAAVWLSDGRTHVEGSHLHPVHQQMKGEVDVTFDGLVLDRILGGSHLSRRAIGIGSKQALYSTVLNNMRLFREDELLRLFRPEYHDMAREAPAGALKGQIDQVSGADPKGIFDEFYLRTYVAFAPTWQVAVRDVVDVAFPTVDNDLFDIMFRVPPERKLNHRLHRRVLMRLSPELARVRYAKTLIPPSAPLLLWTGGMAYRHARETPKLVVWWVSGGRVHIPNTYQYVDHDGWLRADPSWKSFYNGLLLGRDSRLREYLNQEYIGHLIEEHRKGMINAAYQIMRPLTLEIFLRRFFP